VKYDRFAHLFASQSVLASMEAEDLEDELFFGDTLADTVAIAASAAPPRVDQRNLRILVSAPWRPSVAH